jgi:class 3 adenylate cyclase
VYQLLTFTESDRRLDELLRVKISEPNKPAKVAALDELAHRKISPGERMALSQLNRDLLVFVAQANPVLRPVAREYQQIAALLARGKRRGIAKRLLRLDATCKQLAVRMSDIDDYMNWFEATQMKNGSGNFTDYLKAVDQSQLSASKRHDPLSAYVDALEDQFEN